MRATVLAPDYKVDIIEIGHQMNVAGLPKEFIASAVSTAFEFEGAYDLIRMWADEEDPSEKEEIIADIQEVIDDCAQQEHVEGSYIRLDDLEAIAKNIRQFKDNLRAEVDKNGGIQHVSKLTGIPQPSLSRFFNTATMPRRTTLYKIARALGLNQISISTQWLH